MKLRAWLNSNRKVFLDRDLSYLLRNLPGFDKLRGDFREDVFLNKTRLKRLEEIKRLYAEGMPAAYIIYKEEFFGLEFEVNPQVLIPRKETELIVEKAIEIIRDKHLSRVLDLGCGCGNIAISIKKFLKAKVTVFASDLSFNGLRVAKKNLIRHNLDVKLVNSDLLMSFKKKTFDLIVSNPPYVENRFIRGSLGYEPRLALKAKDKGMFFIKKILKQGYSCLKKDGFIIIEIGYNHKKLLDSFIKELGFYDLLEWIKDYSGHWRGVLLKKKRGTRGDEGRRID